MYLFAPFFSSDEYFLIEWRCGYCYNKLLIRDNKDILDSSSRGLYCCALAEDAVGWEGIPLLGLFCSITWIPNQMGSEESLVWVCSLMPFCRSFSLTVFLECACLARVTMCRCVGHIKVMSTWMKGRKAFWQNTTKCTVLFASPAHLISTFSSQSVTKRAPTWFKWYSGNHFFFQAKPIYSIWVIDWDEDMQILIWWGRRTVKATLFNFLPISCRG